MIDCLKYGNRIILMAVTVNRDYLESALAFFDKNLSENSVTVSNPNNCFNVEIPEDAKNLKGRAKKYRVKFKIL